MEHDDLTALEAQGKALEAETRAAGLETAPLELSVTRTFAQSPALRALRRLLRTFGPGDGLILMHLRRERIIDSDGDEALQVSSETHLTNVLPEDLRETGARMVAQSVGLDSLGEDYFLDDLGGTTQEPPDD